MAMPNTKRIERQGLNTEPLVHHYPDVRGGVCEWCGIMNPMDDSINQYKLCEHYRGLQLKCSYCDGTKDPDEVIRRSRLQVMDSPMNPGELVVVCDSYECSAAHRARFQKSN